MGRRRIIVAGLVSMAAGVALLGAVDADRAGTASGVLNTSRQVGGALAVAVFGTLLAHFVGGGVGISMALCVLGLAATALLVLRQLPR